MHTYEQLLIGSRWESPSTTRSLEVYSPHDGERVGTVPAAETEDIDRAVQAARLAFDKGIWPRMAPGDRATVVARFAQIYESRIDEMAELITREMGSPISFSRLSQARAPGAILRSFLRLAEGFSWEETRSGGRKSEFLVRHEPVGVVAAIVPWNVPQFVTMAKLAPALLAGCTIVLKPSPETALDAMLLADSLAEAEFPAGVVSVIPGGPDIGEHLVRHPGVDKVAFTGSTTTGRVIASICGEHLKRVTLELGGKSAAIILDDADLAFTVDQLKSASLMNNGQACIAQSRILAPRAMYDEVVDALADMFTGLKVGDPMDAETDIGPLVSKRQQQRVNSYIDVGGQEGARAVAGGRTSSNRTTGCYVEPTLFADVDNSMRIAREEIFGPVLVVIPYDSDDDAVTIANDSEFGLAGSVWTSDHDRGVEIARQVRVGTFGVNMSGLDLSAPFGGFGASGIGREFGSEGLLHYLEVKTVLSRPVSPKSPAALP